MLHRGTALAAAVAAALALVGVPPNLRAQAPQAPPVYRAGVDIVQLDVSVLDENRLPISGLTADDFVVLEDGVPQPVVSFAAVNIAGPSTGGAAWIRDVAPDVTSNHLDAQRVVVILMDDCHSPFDPMVSKIAKRIAHDTVDHLGESDLAAVVYTALRRQGQEFTRDRSRLAAAVDRFTPQGRSPTPPPFAASRTAAGQLPYSGGNAPCPGAYRAVQSAMQNAATVLRGYPGWRKTLVFISPFTPVFEAESIETAGAVGDWAAVFDTMQEANMTVYQFDPRGLEVGADITQDLGMFADATGGRTVTSTNAPEASVSQVFRENSSYYMLGFQPLNPARNGRFRPIRVRVDRPGVTVRTRDGYFAPGRDDRSEPSDGSATSAGERAIAGALPAGDLLMSLAAAPVPGQGARSTGVAVLASFTPIGLAADGETVEVLVSAFRDDWKEVATVAQTVQVNPPAVGAGPPHVDIPVDLELPPGRYEIRAALTRTAAGQTGSAFTSVVVPNFSREGVSLSGVLIDWRPGDVRGGDRTVREPSAWHLTTVRSFRPADVVSARMTVHQDGRRPAAPVDVEMRIVDTSDRVRATRRLRVEPASFDGTGARLQFDLPLDGLEPGEYLASFSASSLRGEARRQVRLTVRAADAGPPAR